MIETKRAPKMLDMGPYGGGRMASAWFGLGRAVNGVQLIPV